MIYILFLSFQQWNQQQQQQGGAGGILQARLNPGQKQGGNNPSLKKRKQQSQGPGAPPTRPRGPGVPPNLPNQLQGGVPGGPGQPPGVMMQQRPMTMGGPRGPIQGPIQQQQQPIGAFGGAARFNAVEKSSSMSSLDSDSILDLSSSAGFGGCQPESTFDFLTNLINLQMANGSFKFGQAFQALIGKTEVEIIGRYATENEDQTTWLTALAIILLEMKFPNDNKIWELVVKKAKKYIQSNGKSQVDGIIQSAKNFLS